MMSRCKHPRATHYACDCQQERIARLEADVARWKEAYEIIGRDSKRLEEENIRLIQALERIARLEADARRLRDRAEALQHALDYAGEVTKKLVEDNGHTA